MVRKSKVKLVYDLADIRKHQERRKAFAISGLLSIAFITASGVFLSIWSTIFFALGFVKLFVTYRFYDRVKNIYQAIVYSYIITCLWSLFTKIMISTLEAWLKVVSVVMIGVCAGLCYIGYKGLEYMWNFIGEE